MWNLKNIITQQKQINKYRKQIDSYQMGGVLEGCI